ncbi:MAG: efflux RND transporter permease subunit [Nitrospinales bacterium]
MLDYILRFAISQRFLVFFVTLAIAGLGIHNFERLPIDAVPDITNVQVQINTEASGFTPLEIEQRITFPIETAIAGTPKLVQTRSLSRYGLSQVTAIFEDDTDIYFARQLISNRIQESKSKIPSGLEPKMGPISTGLGEIFMWTVEADKTSNKPYSLTELRTVQDWIIKPQLRTLPGVAEVNSIGGYVKQFHVTPDPAKLISYGISFRNVRESLVKNNSNSGAGYIEHAGEQYLIRSPGQVSGIEDIKNIVLGVHQGIPVYVKDIAEVQLGKELRTGAATQNGEETVLGTVFMLKGENSRTVSQRVEKKMEEINRTLPEGVIAKTVYNRTKLVNETLVTVRNNLLEGALLVILILLILLGNIRAALITALVIPLSMLFAVTGMVERGISGNLLSLGAIDFGIIVDGSVIIIENCIRRLSEEQKKLGRILNQSEKSEIVFQASKEVSRPSIFGVLIIMIVYLPILTLTGVEGKMFQPMAFTVLAALTGAMIFSIMLIPGLVAQFSSSKSIEKQNIIIKWCETIYAPALDLVLRNKASIITLSMVLIILSSLLVTKMGSEFLPTLDEKDLAIHALRIPGTSLKQAVKMQHAVEQKINEFPEANYVFTKIGTAEIATDPMPPSVADVFVIMKPISQWPESSKSKPEFLKELAKQLQTLPGNKYEFTQPIEMRFNELIAGVRSDIGVKVFGDDMEVLIESANEIENVLAEIPGASDVRVEQVTGLPVLNIKLKIPEMARLGLDVSDIQDVIEIAIGGKKSGQVFEKDQRFDLIVRLPENVRTDIELLKRIPIPSPLKLNRNTTSHEKLVLPGSGSNINYIPLGSVADFIVVKGPNQITRENGKRRVVVTANVSGRDLGSFVKDAQNIIDNKVKLPAGYWLAWGGQFENLISATKRLWVVVPIALLLIFFLLFTAFGSIKNALLIFSGVPFALTGGLFFLWIRGMPLSISAAVGFIALSGVATLNGIVMISFINKLFEDGMPLEEAIQKGALRRLRPVLMTALVASLGFVPMALSTGTGAEIQQPLATVVIGGIVSSTALTLLVLPVLYRVFHSRAN